MSKTQVQSWRRVWALLQAFRRPGFQALVRAAQTMRISFGGRYSIEEFEDAIERILYNLRQNGVEEFLNVNLYLTPHDRKRVIELLDEQGQVIEHIKYDGPRERAFQRSGSKLRVIRPARFSFNSSRPGEDQ
jgi:hypothetical protein